MKDCIFCKIAGGQIKSDVVFKDDKAMVINDINPQAPVHMLVLPLVHIESVADIHGANEPLMGHLVAVANDVAKKQGLAQRGYRLQVNCGPDGGQTVFHLHVHLFGGRQLGPLLCKHTQAY